MSRNLTFLSLLFLICQLGWTQTEFSEEKIYKDLKKAIVTVEVKHTGGRNACTGFVWGTPDQVVTSLHAMKLGGRVIVKYFNDARYTFEAIPIAVYKDADLVLLRVLKGNIEIPPVVPWTKNDLRTEKISTGEMIYTIGYPGGAQYASNMELKKGWIDKPPPETLESFLDKIYVDRLRTHQFPSVNIEIVYVKGSLSAGYSGSPCVDKNGKLVGIGDGGLENGARAISWLIPSRFLVELETSRDRKLPEVLASSLHFSASIPYADANDDNWAESPLYDSIASEDFEFYLIKNRSLQEMYESSGNDYNLIRILNQFKSEFNVSIDPMSLRFDVYEDIKKGIIVAIPEGKRFYYHQADNHFQVDTAEGRRVNILFSGSISDNTNKNIDGELDLTFRWLEDSMKTYWNIEGNFSIVDDFTNIYNLYDNPNISDDDNRKVANVLMKSDPEIEKDGSSTTVYLYTTMLLAKDKQFISIASYKISNDRINNARALDGAMKCPDETNPGSDCKYFQAFITAFCSAHLTTFAY